MCLCGQSESRGAGRLNIFAGFEGVKYVCTAEPEWSERAHIDVVVVFFRYFHVKWKLQICYRYFQGFNIVFLMEPMFFNGIAHTFPLNTAASI